MEVSERNWTIFFLTSPQDFSLEGGPNLYPLLIFWKFMDVWTDTLSYNYYFIITVLIE